MVRRLFLMITKQWFLWEVSLLVTIIWWCLGESSCSVLFASQIASQEWNLADLWPWRRLVLVCFDSDPLWIAVIWFVFRYCSFHGHTINTARTTEMEEAALRSNPDVWCLDIFRLYVWPWRRTNVQGHPCRCRGLSSHQTGCRGSFQYPWRWQNQRN